MLTAHVHLHDDARRGNAQQMAHVYMYDDVRHMIDVTNIYVRLRAASDTLDCTYVCTAWTHSAACIHLCDNEYVAARGSTQPTAHVHIQDDAHVTARRST